MRFSGQRDGKGTASGATVMTPTRLMTARKKMGDRVAQIAAENFQGETMSSSTTALALPHPICSQLAPRDYDHPARLP